MCGEHNSNLYKTFLYKLCREEYPTYINSLRKGALHLFVRKTPVVFSALSGHAIDFASKEFDKCNGFTTSDVIYSKSLSSKKQYCATSLKFGLDLINHLGQMEQEVQSKVISFSHCRVTF